MSDEEKGPDESEMLRQISGPAPMEDPLPEALPELEPPSPEAADPPVLSRPVARPSWWELHRHELAGLLTAGVALVWISLGLAARAWAPSLLGVTFALGALLIGSQAVWTGE